jgi:hypothetical protein
MGHNDPAQTSEASAPGQTETHSFRGAAPSTEADID